MNQHPKTRILLMKLGDSCENLSHTKGKIDNTDDEGSQPGNGSKRMKRRKVPQKNKGKEKKRGDKEKDEKEDDAIIDLSGNNNISNGKQKGWAEIKPHEDPKEKRHLYLVHHRRDEFADLKIWKSPP